MCRRGYISGDETRADPVGVLSARVLRGEPEILLDGEYSRPDGTPGSTRINKGEGSGRGEARSDSIPQILRDKRSSASDDPFQS